MIWRVKESNVCASPLPPSEPKPTQARAILPSVPCQPDKVFLANFPAHYTLWVHKKGDPHAPRKDHYLYGESSSRCIAAVRMVINNLLSTLTGSRYVAQFRSPMEFCLHLKWLLDGQPMKENGRPDCRCCYCDGSVPQGEISSAFGRYHPSRRDRDKKDRDKGGGGKRPRTKASRAAASTTIPFKDYTKLNTAS